MVESYAHVKTEKIEILRDKTMEDKLINNPNDDKPNYPFCRLRLLVEKFGDYIFGKKKLNFNKSIQSF